jgi:hypothetical protein
VPHDASTAGSMEAWNCRRRWCRNAWTNIAMTLDTCGHLFLRGNDGKELAEPELRLIG